MERRWHYYVGAYTVVEPTEGVQNGRVRLPMLKRHRPRTGEDDDSAEMVAAYGKVKPLEQIVVRIGVENYRPKFKENSEDYLLQPIEGDLVQAVEAETERKTDQGQEKALMNNRWMKGRSKNDVDKFKQDFAGWKESGLEAKQDGAQADQVMEDT